MKKGGVESDDESGSYESGSSYESDGDSLSGSWESSSSSSNQTQSDDDDSQNSSVYSTESKSSSASSYSTSTEQSSDSAAQTKDKKGALLEVSRDKSLSAKQRQAKMNQIMATSQEGTREQGSMGNKKTGKPRFEDSVHEVNFDDDVDIKPQRTSRDKLQNPKVSALIKRLSDDDPAFTSVSLSRENLTDGDIVPLLGALRISKSVTALNLSHNRISSKGASSLAKILTGNSVLRELDVSGNNLGDGGVRHLSEALPYTKSLKVLELEENGITDAGVLSLAETINESRLERLNLNGNQIGDAASSLFKNLASNETMTTLELHSNNISDKGATELASALLDNETLLAVDLGENEVTNRGANDLLKVLRVNDTLEELELAGNSSVTNEMMEMIQEVLGEEDYSSSDGESENDASGEDSAKRESQSTAQPETGANAMLTDMPDETNAALGKRMLIQAVMQDKSLSAQERNKKIQDVMSGRVELPKVDRKKKTRKPTASDQSHGKSDKVNHCVTTATGTSTSASEGESTGAEAMLTDMPDENDTALRKRQVIREIMQNKNLSVMQRNQKIQDVMAGRVELPPLRKKDPPSFEIPKAVPNIIDKERDSGLPNESQVKSQQRRESSRSSGQSRRRKSNSIKARRESQTSTNAVAHEWKKRMMVSHLYWYC